MHVKKFVVQVKQLIEANMSEGRVEHGKPQQRLSTNATHAVVTATLKFAQQQQETLSYNPDGGKNHGHRSIVCQD